MRKLIWLLAIVSTGACSKDNGNGGNADGAGAQDLAVLLNDDLAVPTAADLRPNAVDLAGSDMAEMLSGAWLHTTGNEIRHEDSSRFEARGANLQDTRSCNRCTTVTPSVPELKHRIDTLVDDWHANFIRLTLESFSDNAGYRIDSQWQTVLDDSDYLADIVETVDYIGTKPGVYVLVSIWNDPSLTAMGWPTAQTRSELELLVTALGTRANVIFGVSNEPQSNDNGMLDDECWDAMNIAVQTIRDKETQLGVPHHLVAVQGTRGWARVLDYYTTHPITAGGGANVVYETHVYDAASYFKARFEDPQKTIPVIIGEFGPADVGAGLVMTLDECDELMKRAEALSVPWLAWTFHQACAPGLIEESGSVSDQCGGLPSGMPITATDWGLRVKDRLAKAYNAP